MASEQQFHETQREYLIYVCWQNPLDTVKYLLFENGGVFAL